MSDDDAHDDRGCESASTGDEESQVRCRTDGLVAKEFHANGKVLRFFVAETRLAEFAVAPYVDLATLCDLVPNSRVSPYIVS